MAWFIITIILLICALLWLIFAPSKVNVAEGGDPPRYISLRKGAWVFVILGIITLILSGIAVVGTRNVGVPTVFGATTGSTYDAGLTLKAPWEKVTDVDATIQSEEYKGDSCIYVKIADGGSACISLAYRWRINPDHADVAFADYRKSKDGMMEGIREALVSTNIKAAINEELGKYNPLDGSEITSNMTPEEIANTKINVVPDYEAINAAIKANVDGKIANLGGLIDIQSVTISYVKLPDATQDRINAFNQAVQNTRIAIQEVATKNAQADANKVLADSLKDPNVLVSKCLDGLISGDINAPAGFQCWPGTASGVVVPAAK